jgi:hypothetical protein
VESDRRRSKRRELTGQRWWLAVLVVVALSSWWTAVVADGGSSSSLLCFAASSSSVFRLFCQQYSSLSTLVSGDAAGDGQEEEWRGGRWVQTVVLLLSLFLRGFLCLSLFLLLLLFLTVQGLLSMTGRAVAAGGDDGGGGVAAAASNGGERDAQVAAVSPFYADAQASPFFLHERCSETSRGRRWQEAEEE